MVRPTPAIKRVTQTNNMNNTNIDPRKLIDFFGGVSALHQRLQKAKVEVDISTIKKWKERLNMPANRLAQLALIARKDGREFDLYDFLTMKSAAKMTNRSKIAATRPKK